MTGPEHTTPLKIVMTPMGSSGDVHPYLGIGAALRERGHEVVVVASGHHEQRIERAGLRYVEHGTKQQYEALLADRDLWHPTRGVQRVMQLTVEYTPLLYERLEAEYEPGRTVLVGHPISFATRCFEEKHDAPAATLALAPIILRTCEQMPVIPPGLDLTVLPRPLKRLTWWIADRFFVDPHIEPTLNAFRATIGLPPVRRIMGDWIHAPRRVIGLWPAWFGPPQPDWPEQTVLTGFPLFDEAGAHALPGDVEQFIASCDRPPIAFTPGSACQHGERFFSAAVEATRRLRRGALLLTPWTDQLPANLHAFDHVRHVPYAPFSALLPRCAAIVHHGGIGTCAQGLACGVAQLVMPMSHDQFDNAARLERLGVGASLTPRCFTARRLARKLAALLDDERVAFATSKCADRIRHARGESLQRTCELIEAVVVD